MKKLLFIGALLIAGATSFGAVSAILTNSSGAVQGENLSAEATLKLTSRGNIIDATGKAILIVTPTINAGADGESLSFDFADMIIDQPQTLVGKFTSKVVTAGNPSGIKELPFNSEATLTTTLSSVVKGEGTVSGNTLHSLPLIDTGDGSEIGSLTYTISTIKTNSTTYTTEVTATAIPEGEGSFLNKGAQVTVKVDKFTYQAS